MQEQTAISSLIGEDRIREAFAYAASGMAITRLDGTFEETNAAYREIVGRTEQQLEPETILSLTHPEDRQNCGEQLARLLAGKVASFVVEKRYLRPDGTPAWVRNSFSLLKDQQGRPSHIILICNDITERRRAERLLMESEKLAVVGLLAASIAHEINNPLEAAMNLLYLVREAETLDQARQYASQAEEEIERVAKIATHTLRFHKEQAKPGLTNVGELLESVLVLFKGKLALSRIDLQFDKEDAPEMICYPGEIRQVLVNLIRNAIEAMPNSGSLRLRVRPSTHWGSGGSGVRVTVADTGHGMSLETRRRIYEPFFSTKGAHGTGLGLWVTAAILTKHRGSMRVRSNDIPGRSGTTFALSFPREGAEGEAAGFTSP